MGGSDCAMIQPSVVIHDFDFVRVTITPEEARSPLVIDSNAPLSGTITPKFLQPVRRWDREILESRCRVEHAQFTERDTLQIRRQLPRTLQPEQFLGFTVRPAAYHVGR